jgi:hypothetical protein
MFLFQIALTGKCRSPITAECVRLVRSHGRLDQGPSQVVFLFGSQPGNQLLNMFKDCHKCIPIYRYESILAFTAEICFESLQD